MSLINDALKRAKTAQQNAEAPAASAPQLRPVEPSQPARHGLGLALPVICVVLALLGAFLLWRVAGNRGKEGQTVKAAEEGMSVAARTAAPQPTPNPDKLAPASVVGRLAPQSATNSARTVASALAGDATVSSNATSAAQAPPKPAPLKLQGIVYNPTRPSATISGRTVFVGDRVGEFRVIAIGPDSATLVGGGKTNQLELPQ